MNNKYFVVTVKTKVDPSCMDYVSSVCSTFKDAVEDIRKWREFLQDEEIVDSCSDTQSAEPYYRYNTKTMTYQITEKRLYTPC